MNNQDHKKESEIPTNNPGGFSEQTFADKVWETLNKILDRFLSRNPKEAELRAFMADESNLYNDDGKLTDAYKEKIKEMEEYVLKHSIDDDIKVSLAHDDVEDAMYSSIIDFVNRRKRILEEFSNEAQKKGADFSPEKFIMNIVDKNSSTEEERKDLLDAIENLAQEDALGALDDKDVCELFKDIINKH
jgi:hypothetical protein